MRAVESRFISLADALRPKPAVVSAPAPPQPAEDRIPADSGGRAEAPSEPSEILHALRDARLFRAALADALDSAVATLVRRIAVDVVARELRLDAAGIAVIAQRLLCDWQAETPLRLRVAPADAHVDCGLPLVADPELEPGDAVLECRSGSIDARLGVRLAAALMAAT